MDSPNVPNSAVLESQGNHITNNKHIVEVHSPLTRMIPKKNDSFNQPRPVLHKYRPEQVEVVYHRKSGEEEVVNKSSSSPKVFTDTPPKLTSKNRSGKKRNGGPSSLSNSTVVRNLGDFSEDCCKSLTEFSQHEMLTDGSANCITNSTTKPEESMKVTSNEDIIMGATSKAESDDRVVENSNNAMSKNINNNNNNGLCTESVLLSKIHELTGLVSKLNSDISSMEARLKQVEGDNRVIVQEHRNLCQHFLHHLQSNSQVAGEMKRLQAALKNSEDKGKNEEIENLLARAMSVRGVKKQKDQPNAGSASSTVPESSTSNNNNSMIQTNTNLKTMKSEDPPS